VDNQTTVLTEIGLLWITPQIIKTIMFQGCNLQLLNKFSNI